MSGRNYIAGDWAEAHGGDTYEKTNPWRPSEAVGSFASSGEADVDAAVEAAHAAFPAWSRLPLAARGAYLVAAAASLERRADDVARDMSREMGKPLREARGETLRAAQILRYSASEAFRPVGEHFEQALNGRQVSTRRRPVGVVGLITPWNFPIAIPVWKLAPALMYGNTVVLKLAYEAPRTGLHVAEAFAEAGLPAGVLNVLTGRGSSAGAALVRDPRVRAISFTGSVPTGHGVRDEATRAGKRVQLELGGHNPLIVMGDADLARAAEAAYAGAFWSAGQKCTATRRIYVQDAVYDAFRDAFLGRIERGRNDGGEVATGGERAHEEAYLLPPTVFEGVRDDAFLSCEEVFGPVTSLYRFGDLDEALARANAVPFGLSASIFTASLATATRFQDEAQAGLLHVNSQTAGADVHVPFGGIKQSGFGPHEQGRAAIEFYTEVVTIYVDP